MARIPHTMALQDLDQVLPQLVDRGLPDGGEFLVADLASDEHTHALIALLIWHGYLPMGGMGMLLPKIHKHRCVLPPGNIHIGRKVRRRAKGFHLTVDQAWPVVVGMVQKFTYTSHKGDCWLSDELAEAYEAVGTCPSEWRRGNIGFHSVELWDTASGELVAGEIGYTCGSVYSSCTGFTMKDEYPGTGAVQLAALGRWLAKCGFTIWDLGMELDYKRELGCELVPRHEWARRIRTNREKKVVLTSPDGTDAEAARLIGELTHPLGDAEEKTASSGYPTSAQQRTASQGSDQSSKKIDNTKKQKKPGPKNDDGAPVFLGNAKFADIPGGDGTGKWYCGRKLGQDVIPGSDGRCGPCGGPQCPSCKRFDPKTSDACA